MRVAQRTSDTLVIQEGAGTNVLIGSVSVLIGAVGALIGWTRGPALFLLIGPIFLLYGLKVLLFNRTKAHRFERERGRLAIDSKGLFTFGSRELPFDSIADIVLEEIRKAGSAPSYYVYYVTKQGERIIWADSYDGSKENTLECFNAAREFLRMGEPKDSKA
jgi:hypothetical protein